MNGDTNGANLDVEMHFPTRVGRKDRELLAGKIREGLTAVVTRAPTKMPLGIEHYAPPGIDKARIVIAFPVHDVRRQVVDVVREVAGEFLRGRNCTYELIDQATGRPVELGTVAA